MTGRRLVFSHPVLAVLGVVVLIGLVGVVVDSLTGPSASGDSGCTEPVRVPKGQQQLNATLEYERLWDAAAPLLGSEGQPPPRLKFIGSDAARPSPNSVMWVGPDASNCRTIFIAPGARKVLGNPGKTRADRRRHRASDRWALHETAHYFQSDAVLSSTSLREFGATEWEKAHSREILGSRKGKSPPTFNRWRDREQFGTKYGGNPLTFLWPTGVEPQPGVLP
jgi:hypothetical protein